MSGLYPTTRHQEKRNNCLLQAHFRSARNGKPARYFRKPAKSNWARMQPLRSPASARISPYGSTIIERPA
jgi:hypothetical protein